MRFYYFPLTYHCIYLIHILYCLLIHNVSIILSVLCCTCRSCTSYTPNPDFILASSLNSTHRIIPLHNTTDTLNSVTPTGAVHQYIGHKNDKFSVTSSIYNNSFGNFLLSGSEDGLVSTDIVYFSVFARHQNTKV